MPGRMDEGYFEEKKSLATDAVKLAIDRAGEAAGAIDACRFGLQDLVSPKHVHDLLLAAQRDLEAARRDFEKARWASAKTDLAFNDWLIHEGRGELKVG